MGYIYPNNPLVTGNAVFSPYLNQIPTNPIIPNYQPVTQQGPRMQIDTVNGKESAYAYNIGPNSSVLLADATNPVVWMVTTDASGYKSIKGFKIEELSEEPQQVTATVEDSELKQKMTDLIDRLDKLEMKVDSYGQSDIKSVNAIESSHVESQSNDWNGKNSKRPDGRR